MNHSATYATLWHRIQAQGQRFLVLAVLALVALGAARILLPAASGLSPAAGLHATHQRESAQADTPIIRD